MERLARGVDHDGVSREVLQRGAADDAYLMMTILSAGIATLGLLLSSPAVVIGAMLLSPLMGPIVLLGFSFWTVDWPSTLRASLRLVLGFVLGLGVAVLLTWASPLKEPTAEILARARPTLFDLLVAVFSGVAGGYAVIRGRGETAIAVAIATALMPPIATVGFGLGTQNWAIAWGALLLFATNLVAIALAVAGVAAVYGFRPNRRQSGRRWLGRAAVALVLIGLCVPLTLSLEQIALESRVTANARKALKHLFGPKARLTSLQVRADQGVITVDALIATPKFVHSASDQLARVLRKESGASIKVALDQVVLAHPAELAANPSPPVAPPSPSEALRAAIPFKVQAIGYDPKTESAVVLLGRDSGVDLTSAFALETALRARADLPTATIVPAVAPLPAVAMSRTHDGQIAFGPNLAIDRWALQRWNAANPVVLLCGRHAPSSSKLQTALGSALGVSVATVTRGDRASCGPAPPGPVPASGYLRLSPTAAARFDPQ